MSKDAKDAFIAPRLADGPMYLLAVATAFLPLLISFAPLPRYPSHNQLRVDIIT